MKITKVEFDADPRKCAVILEDGSKLERVRDMACAISTGGMLEVTVTVLVPNIGAHSVVETTNLSDDSRRFEKV